MTCLETNHSSRTTSFRKRIKSETHLSSDLYFINYCIKYRNLAEDHVLHSASLLGPELQA